jgi:hypothetical protein
MPNFGSALQWFWGAFGEHPVFWLKAKPWSTTFDRRYFENIDGTIDSYLYLGEILIHKCNPMGVPGIHGPGSV